MEVILLYWLANGDLLFMFILSVEKAATLLPQRRAMVAVAAKDNSEDC
jgi:hypothetical protein